MSCRGCRGQDVGSSSLNGAGGAKTLNAFPSCIEKSLEKMFTPGTFRNVRDSYQKKTDMSDNVKQSKLKV
jgi:hypothetical protein